MEFHITRAARDKYQFDELLFLTMAMSSLPISKPLATLPTG